MVLKVQWPCRRGKNIFSKREGLWLPAAVVGGKTGTLVRSSDKVCRMQSRLQAAKIESERQRNFQNEKFVLVVNF